MKPIFLGEVAIAGNNDSFTAGGNASTLTAGSYFPKDPTAAESLADHFQARLVAPPVSIAAATVTFSYLTGKFTIGGATFTLVWDDGDLRDLLGFTGASASVVPGGVTGANQARWVWRPNAPAAPSRDQPTSEGTYRNQVRHTRAFDGSARLTSLGQLRDKRWAFSSLSRERVHIDDTGNADWTNLSLERFWVDVIQPGSRVRIYQDEADATATGDRYTYKPGPVCYGAFDEPVIRSVRKTGGLLWSVELDFIKDV